MRPRSRARTPLLLLALTTASCAAAGTDLLWRSDARSLAAGGSFAPAPLLGDVTPHCPTSLSLSRHGRVTAQLRARLPLVLRKGNRQHAELRMDTRELRATVPLGLAAERSHWYVGYSLASTSVDLSHRWKWFEDELGGDLDASTFAIAWSDGHWTLGAARRDADLTARATGDNTADLQNVHRGDEGLGLTWDGRVDTVGAQYRESDWTLGAQLSWGEHTTGAATDPGTDPYAAIFRNDRRSLQAWWSTGPPDDRLFAYLIRSETDPGPGAIASGDAIRGRASLGADETILAAGRRRTTDDTQSHLELTWLDQSLDGEGRLDYGAMGGGTTGRYRTDLSARSRAIGARWGYRRRLGDWSYILAASAMHATIDMNTRFTDSPGAYQPPEVIWDQRLSGDEAWLGSVAVGAGRRVGSWQIDAVYTLLGGQMSPDFEDLAAPAQGTGISPAEFPLPGDEETGPGRRLDLGWLFSVSISREL